MKAALLWAAPEAPQVPWAIEVAPQFMAVMFCVPEKLRFTWPALGEAGKLRVALEDIVVVVPSSSVPALTVTLPGMEPAALP